MLLEAHNFDDIAEDLPPLTRDALAYPEDEGSSQALLHATTAALVCFKRLMVDYNLLRMTSGVPMTKKKKLGQFVNLFYTPLHEAQQTLAKLKIDMEIPEFPRTPVPPITALVAA